MTVQFVHRADPCAGCGRAVADVRIYGDKTVYGDHGLVADFVMHADGGYPGERVDAECDWPTG